MIRQTDPSSWREEPVFTDLPWLRDSAMDELPAPTRLKPGQSAEVLRDWGELLPPSLTGPRLALTLLWLLSAFNPDGPFYLLVPRGDRGSGKSNLLTMLQRLVDPSTAKERRKLIKKDEDLLSAAQDSYLLAFDNVSGTLSSEISDDLCRLLTGGALGSRAFYQKRHEVVLSAKRPVLLAGIDSSLVRADLMDRALTVELERIPDSNRRTEEDVLAAFMMLRPRIMGMLCDALCATMQARHEGKRYASPPRMADAFTFAAPALEALGFSERLIRAALAENDADALDTSLNASPVARAILAFMREQQEWVGTASELEAYLNSRVDAYTQREATWPKNAAKLMNWLARDRGLLLEHGVAWERLRGSRRDGRQLRLYHVSPSPDGDDAADERDDEERDDGTMVTHGDDKNSIVTSIVTTLNAVAVGAEAPTGDAVTILFSKEKRGEKRAEGQEVATAASPLLHREENCESIVTASPEALSALEIREKRGDDTLRVSSPSNAGIVTSAEEAEARAALDDIAPRESIANLSGIARYLLLRQYDDKCHVDALADACAEARRCLKAVKS